MKINKHRLAHFDSEALFLLEKVQLNPIDPNLPLEIQKQLQIDREGYERYRKLIKDIFESPEVIPFVSEKTIRGLTTEWLITHKKDKRFEVKFTDYIIDKMLKSLYKYKIYFPITNLSIKKSITITGVDVITLNKEFFDVYYASAEESQKKDVEAFRKDYQGRVYATCEILSEKQRAREQTFIRCEIALFLLRICSNTLDDPQDKLVYELETKARIQFDELLEERYDNEVGDGELSISSSAKSIPYTMDEEEIKKIEARGLRKYEHFISIVSYPPSPLQEILLRAIENFSYALGNTNYWERITNLISILDSLLLNDYNINIVSTVSKFASKLLANDPAKRKEIVRIIKKMYDVRSKFVHHAEDSKFEHSELRKLQHYVHGILLLFMKKSEQHQTKQSILKEIDDAIEDAILNAYQPVN